MDVNCDITAEEEEEKEKKTCAAGESQEHAATSF